MIFDVTPIIDVDKQILSEQTLWSSHKNNTTRMDYPFSWNATYLDNDINERIHLITAENSHHYFLS